MKSIVAICVVFVAIAAALPTTTPDVTKDATAVVVDDSEWEKFKLDFNKSYANAAEEDKRRGIYLETKRNITQHNIKHDAGEVSFTTGLNHFSDLTHEEYLASCCGVLQDKNGEIAPGAGNPFADE